MKCTVSFALLSLTVPGCGNREQEPDSASTVSARITHKSFFMSITAIIIHQTEAYIKIKFDYRDKIW